MNTDVYLVKEILVYSDGSEKVVHFNEIREAEAAAVAEESAPEEVEVDEVVEEKAPEEIVEVEAEEAPVESVEESA